MKLRLQAAFGTCVLLGMGTMSSAAAQDAQAAKAAAVVPDVTASTAAAQDAQILPAPQTTPAVAAAAPINAQTALPTNAPALRRRDWTSVLRGRASTLDVVTVADTSKRHRCHVRKITATEVQCNAANGKTLSYSEAEIAALIVPRHSILPALFGSGILTAFGGSGVYGSALLFGMGGVAIVGAVPVAIIGGAIGLGGVALGIAAPATRGHEHLIYSKPDVVITAPMHTMAKAKK